jgi:predicted double-glycine peptidase
MTDIYLGIGLVLAVSLVLTWLTARVARRLPLWGVAVVGFGAVAGLWAWVLWRDVPMVTRVLPFSNAIVLGNWVPLCLAVLLGIGAERMRGRWVRKSVALVPLTAVALWAAYGWMLAPPPKGGRSFANTVAMQTTRSSCSAAAAATLLNYGGIRATEAEMIPLCLTRDSGTFSLGLYRGLKLKTAGSAWSVEHRHLTLDELKRLNRPAILTVMLPRHAVVDARYAREWGWIPGQPHTVVFVRSLSNGDVAIGDPATGFEYWEEESLRVLWTGEVLMLVPRE